MSLADRPFIIIDLNSGRYLEKHVGHEIYNLVPNPIDNRYYGYCPPFGNLDIRSLGVKPNRHGYVDGVLVVYVQKISGTCDREVVAFIENARVYATPQLGEKLKRVVTNGEKVDYCKYVVESDTLNLLDGYPRFIIRISEYNTYMFRMQRVYKGKYPVLDKKLIEYLDDYLSFKTADDDLSFQGQVQCAEDMGFFDNVFNSEPSYTTTGSVMQVSKSARVSKYALRKSGYKCEADKCHTTFNTAKGVQYMEGHHLIPCTTSNAVAFYERFSVNIDCPENIVCLCPTCHRKIHFGSDVEKKGIISQLYLLRLDEFKRIGIEISLAELYSLYGLL